MRADTVRASADAAAREQMAKVVEVLVRDKVAGFDDCVAWARLKFQVLTKSNCFVIERVKAARAVYTAAQAKFQGINFITIGAGCWPCSQHPACAFIYP